MKMIWNSISKIKNYSIKLLRNTKIQSRLMFSFILLSFIPLAFTGILSYNKSSNAIESKVQTYSTQVMVQLEKNIRAKMEKLEYASDEVYLSKIVQDNILPYDTMDDHAKIAAMSDVNEYLKMKFSIILDVLVTKIFDNTGNIYNGVTVQENNSLNSFNRNLTKELPNLRDMAVHYRGAVVWMLPEDKEMNNNILLVRTINSLVSDRPIGTLVIGLKNSYFSDVFKDIDVSNGSYVFIVNSTGVVISSVNQNIPMGTDFRNISIGEMIKENESRKKHYFSIKFDSSNYLMTYIKIDNTDWYIVSTVPFAYLNVETRSIGLYILIITILALLFSVMFTYVISRSISLPLNTLVKGINKTKSGDFNVVVNDDNSDEIGDVTRNFNKMVQEISDLLDNVKNKERQKRKAELRALQAQINPHFLSNTLNTVRWLAKAQKANNINDLVTSLIQLLHVSMGKGDDLITMRQEIEYLENYINIQKYRFNEGFDVEFDIEKKILDCKVLKFLLQPLVENSLIHGLEPKNGQGLVRVKAYQENNNNIRITVIDDGVGITEEKIKDILCSENIGEGKRFCSFGIKNVDERIKLFFGDQYGISITSIPNMFTTVEVVIPII